MSPSALSSGAPLEGLASSSTATSSSPSSLNTHSVGPPLSAALRFLLRQMP